MTAEWSPQVAETLARDAGIQPLGDRRWKVIACIREEFARNGRMPRLPRVQELTGLGRSALLELFPGDATALMARLAGVGATTRQGHPKPAGDRRRIRHET